MTFEDLPQPWDHLPLDDPALAADVVDLFVGHADREGGCACLLVLDADLRLVQPGVLGDVPDDADPWRLRDGLVDVLGGLHAGGLLFARGRPGSVLLTDADRAWHEMVLDVCLRAGVPLVGAFVATPATVRAYPEPLTGVSARAS